jgi:polar amino acid transport system permease protein
MEISLEASSEEDAGSRGQPDLRRLYNVYTSPLWLFVMIAAWIMVALLIITDPEFTQIYNYLDDGIGTTLQVSFLGYGLALVIGLFIGIIRSSTPTPPPVGANIEQRLLSYGRLLLYNFATLYVNLLRGLPMLVVLLLGAFTVIPFIERVISFFTANPDFQIRGTSVETGFLALGLAYGAFLSETFRAGIQSIDKGQLEAARSLGMTPVMTMRHIVLPQAIRRILPPLGNDMIAMIKDSSLVSALGVNDITRLATKWVGTSFKYPQTYLVLSVMYLTMTVIASLLVRAMERRLKTHER